MLHSLSTYFTDQLAQRCRIPIERRAVYIYGFELFLSSISALLSTVILSFVFHFPESSLIFFLCFYFVRLFAGGYHAKTYLQCFLLTNTIYLVVYGISLGVAFLQIKWLTLFLVVCSCSFIFINAPIRHKNHPLSDYRYKKNRIIARIEATAFIVIWILAFFSEKKFQLLSFSSITITAVAVMMIVSIIQEKRSV